MIVKFIGQPFEDNSNLHDFLVEALPDPAFNQLVVVTAWAKRSGLRRVEPQLRSFRERGGQARIVLGIDEGGATRQGLELAIELFDHVFVFHDSTRRTFHPKIYVVRGTRSARLFLGSNNLTAGGVFFNYEAAVGVHLDLSGSDDRRFLEAVEAYAGRLLDEAEICLSLDQELLERLVASRRFRIRDEDEAPQRDGPEDTGESEGEGEGGEGEEADASGDSPFGRSRLRKRTDPLPRDPRRTERLEPATPLPRPAVGPAPAAPESAVATVPRVERRWTKRLFKTDAQQSTSGTQLTGNLRLTKAGHPIDWRTFFREDLFGSALWTPENDTNGNQIEIARIPVEVVIHGSSLGRHDLTIDHAPHREAGQANHVTVLHWGDLAASLRETNYVGEFVVLERWSDGTYVLELRPDAPPAVP